MAVQRYALGRNATAYFNEANTHVDYSSVNPGDEAAGRAAWTTWLNLATPDQATKAAGNLMDVTIGLADDTADATTREVAAWGFGSTVNVLHGAEVTFEMRWQPATRLDTAGAPYTFTELLMANWSPGLPMSLVFLDQNRTPNASGGGNKYPLGLAGRFTISLEKSEALRDIQRASITLALLDDPVWFNEEIAESP